MLDELEARLATGRYLFGSRIVDYPNLDEYLRDLYQQPGIAGNFDHIKRHYYMTHGDINPSRIVPIGPVLEFERPHGLDRASFAR